MMKDQVIITISRQFGSGGKEIGQRLAEKMGIPCYDEQIKEAARINLNLSEYEVQQCEENANKSLIYSIATGVSSIVTDKPDANKYLSLFAEEKRIILDYAERGSCVIIGRAADDILKGYTCCLNVFVRANLVNRMERIVDRYQLMPADAREMISKCDKARASFYNKFAKGRWGDKDTYDLVINSSKLGIASSVEVIYRTAELL